ncbi:hypothetical protein AAHA92_00951 [Salvia divinorum]|uniref:Myb/SANT-like domain-containing protein n=1 Tax=Salvia divinorum TaxID=28513 RepID=A0ABD1ILA5_SALDI
MSDSKRIKLTANKYQGSQLNSSLDGGSKQKGDRTRRSWTEREEDFLLVKLHDLVIRGWKSDNGFRAGYLGKLEEAMGIQFPASRIKGTPHIVSRITAWKKTYNSLVGILQRSGVGFNNHGDFKIDCDDDQWDQIVKADKNARFMRDKSWPQWEAWKEVFGKGRANGSTSEVIMQAVNGLYSQEKQASTGEDEDNNLSFEDLSSNDPHLVDSPDSAAADRSHQTSKDTRGPTPTLKKTTGDQAIDGLLNILGKMHEDTNARLQCLTLRIGYEYDLSKARKEVFEVLGRIPELTLKQRYEAGDIILEKVQRLDFFLGMPEEARLGYVEHALEKYNNK